MASGAPENLIQAVADLWAAVPVTGRLYDHPPFCRLVETCAILYPSQDSRQSWDFAVGRLLDRVGYQTNARTPAMLAVPPEIAAERIDMAFRRSRSTRTHLCPLDLAAEIDERRFGPNVIRLFSKEQLDDLVDPWGIQRQAGPSWRFDSDQFSEFRWLVVEEEILATESPGHRALPFLTMELGRDFSLIKPHAVRFPAAVEKAMFALLTIPWEEIVRDPDFSWRPFQVPWVFTLDEDPFVQRPPLPDVATLSWQTDFRDTGDEVMEEVEVPYQLYLEDYANDEIARLDNAAWEKLELALTSPLFSRPVAHFFVRAFLSDGIDEFLAHVMTVEAALGRAEDYCGKTKTKVNGVRLNEGATPRLVWRLSALLGSKAEGEKYRDLFEKRSDFVHGKEMSAIPGDVRLEARRLARRCVCDLIDLARQAPTRPREEVLQELLDKGALMP